MQFVKYAWQLARNPLGIIALFISSIYGFASLLLNSAAETLTVAERWSLIGFIVVFPLLVLAVFYRLVTHHHGKLYAPGDYDKDRSFMRTLSPAEQEQRLTREVQASLGESDWQQGGVDAEAQVSAADEDSGQAVDDADVAQLLSPQGGTDEKVPLSRAEHLDHHRQQVTRLKDAMLRQMQESSTAGGGGSASGAMTRHVRVGETDACFDALLEGESAPFTFIEVKVLKHYVRAQTVLQSLLYEALLADRTLEANFRLIVVVVLTDDSSQGMTRERLEQEWHQRIRQCPVAIELRFMSPAILKT
ncbi:MULTISPECIES: hypothetical protein [unclassified Cobetia]|uniref:hypothetical protein n=1 Tax=unclassified Cobetia TaxID=2609414 RepID=UPI0020981DD9|nr:MULTISPECIES: hypothetical protein [unclassified Cobetia]MCO7233520.1 hypothetical protein [Cobetia sp. Dlab-2-AX]MCO7236796.1 hypothetical protein [Cobetia sp. Dlab-2-U]